MRAVVEQAGFRVIEQTDFTADVAKRRGPPRQANDVVMGDDLEVHRANIWPDYGNNDSSIRSSSRKKPFGLWRSAGGVRCPWF
jgi:hypothetical protein